MKKLNSRNKKIHPNPRTLKLAVKVVESGGLIVFPWGKLERKCLALMCDSNNPQACKRLNQIKNRSESQVLAINGYPELIPEIAKVEKSKPLQAAAKRLHIDVIGVLQRCMEIGAVSFIFEARDGLSEIVTTRVNGKKTVMIAGEVDDSAYDFYTELVRQLHKKNIITAGSSANRTTTGTYHIFEQDKAYEDLKEDVDLFVYQNFLPKKPIHALNLESCTTFNMVINSDIPEVTRLGSVHPNRFLKVFKGFTTAKNATYLPKREKVYHILIKPPIQILDRVLNRLP